jgi:hypothetical protein
MELLETTIRPVAGGVSVEMAYREVGTEGENLPYLCFLTRLEPHREGFPQFVELQRAALLNVRDAIDQLLPALKRT